MIQVLSFGNKKLSQESVPLLYKALLTPLSPNMETSDHSHWSPVSHIFEV